MQFWDPLEATLDQLRVKFCKFGPKMSPTGAILAHFQPTWDQLGHFWCHLGDYFGYLGSISALMGDVNTKPCSCKHEVVQL